MVAREYRTARRWPRSGCVRRPTALLIALLVSVHPAVVPSTKGLLPGWGCSEEVYGIACVSHPYLMAVSACISSVGPGPASRILPEAGPPPTGPGIAAGEAATHPCPAQQGDPRAADGHARESPASGDTCETHCPDRYVEMIPSCFRGPLTLRRDPEELWESVRS